MNDQTPRQEEGGGGNGETEPLLPSVAEKGGQEETSGQQQEQGGGAGRPMGLGESDEDPYNHPASSLYLNASSTFGLNYNSLKASVTRGGGYMDDDNHTNPYAMTYTAGEDASRLAMAAKELGLARQRKARAQVRRIDVSWDRGVSILATPHHCLLQPPHCMGGMSREFRRATTVSKEGRQDEGKGAEIRTQGKPEVPIPLNWGETLASVAGNILEWYDFAVFGYFGDVIGRVFFPPWTGHTATLASFAVFGGAFIARPAGGVMLGYIGDVYGRKAALRTSIFLMAVPTFTLGCLPSFAKVGYWSSVWMILVRLLQGLSVGGQLLSSLVFTLEQAPRSQWGLYGSFVLATANMGTLLGGLVGYWIRAHFSPEQLLAYGWRIPFWMGVLVGWSGLYVRGGEKEGELHDNDKEGRPQEDGGDPPQSQQQNLTSNEKVNPLSLAFEPDNLRSLLASATVPMLWSAGFYLTFVWMPVYMTTMAERVVPHAFFANSLALLLSVILLFPVAGFLSDNVVGGRRTVMTVGGIILAVLTPWILFRSISESGNFAIALTAQVVLGVGLSLWGSPMCAWLVEAFPHSEARLTSMAIGYNVAQAIIGGLTPALATFLVDSVGPVAPAWIYTIVSCVALVGLWVIAPPLSPSS